MAPHESADAKAASGRSGHVNLDISQVRVLALQVSDILEPMLAPYEGVRHVRGNKSIERAGWYIQRIAGFDFLEMISHSNLQGTSSIGS